MANAEIENNSIAVHGRGSLTLPFQVYDSVDGVESQRDISTHVYYFEVDGAGIRKALVVDPQDPLGLMLQLTRTEVESLDTVPLKFVFVDETNPTYPFVEWHGSIKRIGYAGLPEAGA